MKKFVFDVVHYDADNIISTSGGAPSHSILQNYSASAVWFYSDTSFITEDDNMYYYSAYVSDSNGNNESVISYLNFTSGFYHYYEFGSSLYLQGCNDNSHHPN